MKAHPLDDLSFDSTRKKTIMFYEFWPLVIHLEVLQNRERFAVFFCYKISFLSSILDDVVFSISEIIAGSMQCI